MASWVEFMYYHILVLGFSAKDISKMGRDVAPGFSETDMIINFVDKYLEA